MHKQKYDLINVEWQYKYKLLDLDISLTKTAALLGRCRAQTKPYYVPDNSR